MLQWTIIFNSTLVFTNKNQDIILYYRCVLCIMYIHKSVSQIAKNVGI